MEQLINDSLKKVETKHHVKILYACEAGSRAYGLSTEKSDYDVRFIYIHPLEWYLSIDEKRDVIEVPFSSALDLHGWDLRKTLRLLRKSNPSLLEWLTSGIVYYEELLVMEHIKNTASELFSPLAYMHHYVSMARGNYKDYLKGSASSMKKLFRVLRPILICKWVEQHVSIAPISFQKLAEEVLPKKMYNGSHHLVKALTEDTALDRGIVEEFQLFVEEELNRLDGVVKSIPSGRKVNSDIKLDTLFVNTLHRVWERG
ncbi:putative nucleotidyltransferase [Evansella vedderi]|uniref:Nucleotidyltransferase n=1 Tax=Evansella vedderi TaxID=38282 RepID=A0ABT9ZV32_9BACI|nr:nucleotidyltransferase domain-containing protein [Evansella vedderi]MDQ0255108.1 putative nucleotidyltransferase [Evansella vedderi]